MNNPVYEKLRSVSKKFPNSPGVYFWRNKQGVPLYIGRAGSLKKRIANYFLAKRDPRIFEMTQMAHSLDFEATDTLLEAIVLEANLIKQYWPKYNVQEKDNKSFIYMVVTDEEFPRILMVRGRELSRYTLHDTRNAVLGVFGPYQSYYLLRKALEIVRKIFPYSNCKPPRSPFIKGSTPAGGRDLNPSPQAVPSLQLVQGKTLLKREKKSLTASGPLPLGKGEKPCFHYQIGLCPGVCVGAADSKAYRNNIKNIILFFKGEKRALLKKLAKENPEAIKALAQVRDTALLADSDVLLRGNQLTDRRIEGYDISHSGGKNPVGAMVVFENGEADPSQYRLFNIKGGIESKQQTVNSRQQGKKPFNNFAKLLNGKGFPLSVATTNYSLSTTHSSSDDLVMLEEVIERRLRHVEWPLPQIVFVDGGANQVKRVNEVFKRHGHVLPVVGLSKAGKHAASAASGDKFVVANAKKTGKELILASRNLFQQVRNEAHRFSITAQRRRTKKNFLKM